MPLDECRLTRATVADKHQLYTCAHSQQKTTNGEKGTLNVGISCCSVILAQPIRESVEERREERREISKSFRSIFVRESVRRPPPYRRASFTQHICGAAPRAALGANTIET